MRFMQAYKRLDNLCRDMNGMGITGYIQDMEKTAASPYFVSGWKEDYLHLKRYRHIRNRIAHENDADEESASSPQDAVWLEAFYRRILTQDDPLALYYRATKSHSAGNTSATRIRPIIPPAVYPVNLNQPGRAAQKPAGKRAGCATYILLVPAIVLSVIWLLLHMV